MALTSAQKAAARRFLGYPDVNRRSYYALEGALVALSDEGEDVVAGILTSLGTVHAAIESSWGRQKVTKAEDVILAGPAEIVALRAEGRRLSGELAAMFDVQILRDIWGGSGASGVATRG